MDVARYRLVDMRYCSMACQGKKQVFWLNEVA